MSVPASMPLSRNEPKKLEAASLFDLQICSATLYETVDWLRREVFSKTAAPVTAFTANTDHIIRCRDDAELRRAYAGANLVFADGMPLVWCSTLLGKSVSERVTGIDLFHALCNVLEEDQLSCFLLGARGETLSQAVRKLRETHPALNVCGSRDGYFSSDDGVVELINSSAADVLFVGLGSPKQEIWLSDNAHRLRCKFALVIGGTLDVLAGRVTRAPRLLQKTGFEWSWRLAHEPRRLWRRYLLDCPRILPLLLREMVLAMPRQIRVMRTAWTGRRS